MTGKVLIDDKGSILHGELGEVVGMTFFDWVEVRLENGNVNSFPLGNLIPLEEHSQRVLGAETDLEELFDITF